MRQEPTMECPYCKEIEFEHTDSLIVQGVKTLEFECSHCKQVGFFDENCHE